MRSLFLAATFCFVLAGCGGPETSQANNELGNISKDSRPAPTARARVVIPASTNAVSGNEAKATHH